MSIGLEPKTIRDLLYFDEPKALSILSQFEDGVISEVEAVSGVSIDKSISGGAKVLGVGADVEKQTNETETKIERKKRHHEIVSVLEQVLFDQGFAIDVNEVGKTFDVKSGEAHKHLSQYGFLRVTGWVEFNDYKRLQEFFKEFNGLMHFINESALSKSNESEALRVIQAELSDKKHRASDIKDRNKRFLQERSLQKFDKAVLEAVKIRLDRGKIADWILDGFDQYINMLHIDRFRLQIFPFEEYLPFHIGADLKRDAFAEMDAEHLIRVYDNRPSLPLTLVGLITSNPAPDSKQPNFSARFDEPFSNPALEEIRPFLASFNKIFTSLHSIEHITGGAEFPAISIYPIFLYREIMPARRS